MCCLCGVLGAAGTLEGAGEGSHLLPVPARGSAAGLWPQVQSWGFFLDLLPRVCSAAEIWE